MVVKFKLAKETSGAYRYQEVDDEGKVIADSKLWTIGSLYLRKDKIDAAPKTITVIISSP